MEKRRFGILIFTAFALSSCGALAPQSISHNQQDSEDATLDGGALAPLSDSYEQHDSKTAIFDMSFAYGHIWDSEMEESFASLLYGYSYLSGNVTFDQGDNLPTVAGDQAIISYTGEMYIQETYPGTILVDGSIISVAFRRTEVIGVKIDDATFASYLPELEKKYYFADRHVILDERYRYSDFDDYQGDSIYLTFSMNDAIKNKSDGKTAIAGVYAYNPRG